MELQSDRVWDGLSVLWWDGMWVNVKAPLMALQWDVKWGED